MTSIFSAADVQRLIETFPPPEPRPGKDCLVRSRSGKNLVRSDAITRRFKALLDASQLPLLVSNLPVDLGILDVRWLLEQEASGLFFTRDRERIISRPRQREMSELLRSALQNGGIKLSEWAAQFNLSADTIQRITSQDPTLAIITLEDGISYSEANLKHTRSSIFNHLKQGGDEPINLSGLYQTKGYPPAKYLKQACEEIMSDDDNSIQGSIEERPDGLYFTPASALNLLQKQREEAKHAYIKDALRSLGKKGYCNVSRSTRSDLLRSYSSSAEADLNRDIEAAHQQEHPGLDIVLVQAPGNSDDEGGHAFFVHKDTLDEKRNELASGASQVASMMWEARVAGSEVLFDLKTFASALTEAYAKSGADSVAFQDAVIRSEHADSVRSAFEAKVVELQDTTVKQFADLLRTQLLGPLQLYSKGAESIADNSLQARVLEFITDWARRTLTPEVLLIIRERKLVVTKASLREVDKFGEAVQAAKTLNEVNAAAVKFARKQKLEQPDKTAFAEIKRLALAEKVLWLRRVKRSSDLLQNLTWILLASTREGLYMSSGKDTSRMIKLFQADGDSDAGKKLGELRDLIKGGKETDKEKADMKEMAKAALESLQSPNQSQTL